LFGRTRNRKDQTLYNAARPFRVIGGVSDAEIQLLQAARGPLAKVALCSMWLQEFISREYMAGSTGNVDPPIISRLYQEISDGMVGYSQARKIAYIPFPFPHAQITALFILVVVALIPILMMTFVDNEAFGAVLNGLTVMCFAGLHEVSRELENPFQNVPNGEFSLCWDGGYFYCIMWFSLTFYVSFYRYTTQQLSGAI
jgi:predicted membrane chloride channel (bestrophin family)